jgi:hypothetical protein
MVFCDDKGGAPPARWPRTHQPKLPGAQTSYRWGTPHSHLPGGAQRPDQTRMGVEPTHLLGVLQRLPAHRNHAHPTSIHWPCVANVAGRGVSKDVQTALNYYGMAFDLGHWKAAYVLGTLYAGNEREWHKAGMVASLA